MRYGNAPVVDLVRAIDVHPLGRSGLAAKLK